MPRWTPFEPYFWSLVEKGKGCWLWKSGTYGSGYGRVRRGNVAWAAHRVAYELTVGPIPAGMEICHRCDVKACVKPSHLFHGTQKDNMQDWTRKGKNRLANDRTLWGNGKHWQRKPELRKQLSINMMDQFASGCRVPIRGEKGRIIGTRIKKCKVS